MEVSRHPLAINPNLIAATVSAEDVLRDEIRGLISQHVDDDLRYLEWDFQPKLQKTFWTIKQTEVDHQGVV